MMTKANETTVTAETLRDVTKENLDSGAQEWALAITSRAVSAAKKGYSRIRARESWIDDNGLCETVLAGLRRLGLQVSLVREQRDTGFGFGLGAWETALVVDWSAPPDKKESPA